MAIERPEAFQACFFAWLEALRAGGNRADALEIGQPVLAVDGKDAFGGATISKNGLGALHSVSIWAAVTTALTSGQDGLEEKIE